MSSPSARFFEKSSALLSKIATRLVSRSTFSLPSPSFCGVVEVRKVGLRQLLVGRGQRGDDLLVDLVADVRLALQGDHRLEAGTLRNLDRRKRLPLELVADVLDEQQRQDVVLVLAGIHPAAKCIAARPRDE